MRNALKVWKQDFRNIIKNPMALVIVVGVVIISSLYAWVNIKASWDPYGNTGTIPVAVVNNDKGTTFNDEEKNIGNEVIEKLRDNEKINWKFVESKDANMGVVDGKYYAMIEITPTFSEDMMSVTSDNIKKPQLIYKADTKVNPVTVKIVGSAKSTLVDEITTSFIETVNETIFTSTNEKADKLEENKYKILKIKDSIISIDRNMDTIMNVIKGVNTSSINIKDYLNEVKSGIVDMVSNMDAVNQNGINTDDFISSTQNTLNDNLKNTDFNLAQIKESIERINNILNDMSSSANNKIISSSSNSVNKINREVARIDNTLKATIEFLEDVNGRKPSQSTSNLAVLLRDVKTSIDMEKENINKLQNDMSNNAQANKSLINTIIKNLNNTNANMSNIIRTYNSQAKPELKKIGDSLLTATQDASYLVQRSTKMQDEINKFLDLAGDGSTLAIDTSSNLYQNLDEYKDLIKIVSEKLQTVDNKDIIKIISILQSNPEFMGDFMAKPFNIKEEPIFEVPNYGSAMAPLYTVLSLWVCGVLLVNVLKTEVRPFKGSEHFTIRQKYFGKMLTFLMISLTQALIVALGNKFILGIHTVNTWLMVLFSLVSSFTFMIMIYTLTSMFGSVGKALAIVIMIIQLPSSGGSYPIQVDPKIFKILQPFLPFTYSVGGFREAVAGPLVSSVVIDLIFLIGVAIVFLLFGYFFKTPSTPILKKFEHKLEESGIVE